MTKKTIKIDGVDVAECPFYEYQTEEDIKMRYPDSGDCEIGLAGYLFDFSPIQEQLEKHCLDNPNCDYKHLKRKEQECEWWKRQAELGSDTTDRLAKQLEEKEQELDECREKLHNLNDQLKAELEKEKALKQTYLTCYKTKHGDVKSKLFKYENLKQTLQEIKELAESVTGDGSKCENCETDGYCADCEDKILKQILQKCEVLDE